MGILETKIQEKLAGDLWEEQRFAILAPIGFHVNEKEKKCEI